MPRGAAVVVISATGFVVDNKSTGTGEQLEPAQETRFCSP